MSKTFSELVIRAPFLLIKGFLMGYMQGSQQEFPYFFHRKHGVKNENTGNLMREFLHMECHTHLCLPNDVIAKFRAALQKDTTKKCLEVESIHPINSASFNFSFHNYNEAETGVFKELFREPPAGVELYKFNPLELRGDALSGVTEYGKINQYVYEASGLVTGDFAGVMELYLKIKRHRLVDSILCSEVRLEL